MLCFYVQQARASVCDSLDKAQHSFQESLWEFVLPNSGAQLCESCYRLSAELKQRHHFLEILNPILLRQGNRATPSALVKGCRERPSLSAALIRAEKRSVAAVERC